ncbi:amino acid adenylation domain-containing protein [Enterobacter sp. H2G27]
MFMSEEQAYRTQSKKEYFGLLQGFLDSLESNPDTIALEVSGCLYSYKELSEMARDWAGLILSKRKGVKPENVGVFSGRSLVSYVGVLTALYLGATYVPINIRFPKDRSLEMINRANLDAIILDEKASFLFSDIWSGIETKPIVFLPESTTTDQSSYPAEGACSINRTQRLKNAIAVSPNDNAYLLFTSGSTGVPKGVPIQHRNVTSFLSFNLARYGLNKKDRVSQTFDLTFDLSVFDLFMAWSSSATLCVAQPHELLSPVQYVNKNHITVWFSVPSVVILAQRLGVIEPGSMPTLRWSLFCGEALPKSVAELWQAAAPYATLENLYGPTELTIACAVYRWVPGHSEQDCHMDIVPLGEIYPHLSVAILDEHARHVEKGHEGELCVAGPQRFAGYLAAPELTRQRMICLEDGQQYYRTGDRVRLNSDSSLTYIGRLDHQIKINGYRIELGEVESALRRLGFEENAAIAFPDFIQPTEIRAFVTVDFDEASIIHSMTKLLPHYLVPKKIYRIDSMPLNFNGKVDRNTLITISNKI